MIARTMRGSDLVYALRTWLLGAPVPDAPHVDPEGLAVFEASLRTARRHLEFGAGGSTVMAARLGKRGISIEGDRRYHQSVQRRLRGLSHGIDLIYVDVGRTGKWGRLLGTTPTPERVAAWTRYASAPFEHLTGDFFDLVLVDGRFRVACALHTLAAARPRRASFRLLLDDYDNPRDPRPEYRTIENFVPLTSRAGSLGVFDVTPDAVIRWPDDDTLGAAVLDSR